MSETLLQLYPPRPEPRALHGLYLTDELHRLGSVQQPLVYGNFITSLDGRIGLPRPGTETHEVPPAIANARDWRLYQELAAQADVLLTSARYFRQAAAQQAQDRLPVGAEDAFADLRDWRVQQGLSPQPVVAVISASLDIPLQALEPYRQRGVVVLTGEAADAKRVAVLEAAGHPVIRAGKGRRVDGQALVQALAAQGHARLYAIGGPVLFHTLAAANVIDRLYLSIAHCLLGGEHFDSIIYGPELRSAVGMKMSRLYYDEHAPQDCGQWLCLFERRQQSINTGQGA